MVFAEPFVSRVFALIGRRERGQPYRVVLRYRDPIHRDMIAAASLSGWRVLLRHEQAGGVIVADIEDDQVTAIIVLRGVVDSGGAREPVHDAEANCVLVEHRLKDATDGPLFGPDLDTNGLLVPKIPAI